MSLGEQDPETRLRELWTRKGIPKSVQDALIADVEKKAAPGARVGPVDNSREEAHAMTQERETPKFTGIADPRCRCTPDQLCYRCQPSSPEVYAAIIEQTPDRFRGKFREPWNSAVKKNNIEIKNEGEK